MRVRISMRPRGPRTPDTHKPRATAWPRKGERQREPRGRETRAREPRGSGGGSVVLYGWHTVKAALENPQRRVRKLYATENAARRLAEEAIPLGIAPELVRPDTIAHRLSP